jgi:hypothetical protein
MSFIRGRGWFKVWSAGRRCIYWVDPADPRFVFADEKPSTALAQGIWITCEVLWCCPLVAVLAGFVSYSSFQPK